MNKDKFLTPKMKLFLQTHAPHVNDKQVEDWLSEELLQCPVCNSCGIIGCCFTLCYFCTPDIADDYEQTKEYITNLGRGENDEDTPSDIFTYIDNNGVETNYLEDVLDRYITYEEISVDN